MKALTTTSMVDKMCAAYNLPLVETGVGFKYICAEMLKGGVLLGAEESGGIGFPDHIPERDGIARRRRADACSNCSPRRKSPLTRYWRSWRAIWPHRYGRIDTPLPAEKRSALMEFLKRSAGKIVAFAAGRSEDVRRREIRSRRFLVAHAARFRHGADFCEFTPKSGADVRRLLEMGGFDWRRF